MLHWLKTKGWKYGLFAIIGYFGHLLIEAFVITNVLAYFGLSMPVLV